MKFSLDKFKKISSTPKSTVLQHPDGHQITIAHGPLSPKMREQLSSLPDHGEPKAKAAKMADGGEVNPKLEQSKKVPPKMADGGEVADSEPPVQVNVSDPLPSPPEELANPNAGAIPEGTPEEMSPEAAAASAPGSQPYGTPEQAPQAAPASAESAPAQPGLAAQPSPPQDPYGNEVYGAAYAKGINEQKQGIQGQAQAEGQQGKEQAQTLQHQVEQEHQVLADYNQHYNKLQTERDALLSDFKNGHIDPNHYLGSMSTPQRVATVIGLLIGGLGGPDNAAQKYLHDQIDRDIDAQKANIGQKRSLLDANMQQFGNLKDSTDMTRIMMSDMVSNQLKAAAAKASDPAAKARALMEAGKLDENSAAGLSQISMRRTLTSGQSADKIDPSTKVRLIVPQQEQGAAYKELQSAQDAVALRDNTLGAFDQLVKINTVGNRVGSPIQSAGQVKAIRGAALDKLTKDISGRVTPETVGLIGGMFDTLGKNEETTTIQRKKIDELLSQGMHYPLLKAYNISPLGGARFNPQGASRIQEAAPVLKK